MVIFVAFCLSLNANSAFNQHFMFPVEQPYRYDFLIWGQEARPIFQSFWLFQTPEILLDSMVVVDVVVAARFKKDYRYRFSQLSNLSLSDQAIWQLVVIVLSLSYLIRYCCFSCLYLGGANFSCSTIMLSRWQVFCCSTSARRQVWWLFWHVWLFLSFWRQGSFQLGLDRDQLDWWVVSLYCAWSFS